MSFNKTVELLEQAVELKRNLVQNLINNGIEASINEPLEDIISKTSSSSSSYEAGKEAGKQEEYDRFWNTFQENGKRTSYQYAFYGPGWTDENYKPKYGIKPTKGNGNYMFASSRLKKSTELFNIDVSECEGAVQMFARSTIEQLGILNFSKLGAGWSGLNQTFYACNYLQSIEKLILPTASVRLEGFTECGALTEIRFEGTAYQSITFLHSPLSVASMKSIISCLANYLETEQEYLYTIKFNDDCWAALEADGTAPNGNTWREYVEAYLGWLT